MRSFLLATLALVTITARGLAQDSYRELRAEVVVTLPRIHGYGVLFVIDDRFEMRTLAQREAIAGTGVISPQFHGMSGAVEIRQVRSNAGAMEHRYVPTFYFNLPLPGGFELRDRNRYEIRDIEGAWSHRYVNRTAIGRAVAIAHHAVFPYVQSDFYLDSRRAGVSRLDGTGGIRTQLGTHVSIDNFLAHITDWTKTPRNGLSLGTTVRVQL